MQFVKDFVFFFVNYIVNRIPSRRVRMFFYHKLSSGRISKKATIGLGVRILDIRNVEIGDYSNINFDCILDGRGAVLSIGDNVDLAPQVNVWTLQHDLNSKDYSSVGEAVTIENHCWLANRAILLPGSVLKKGAVLAAGAVFKGEANEREVLIGLKAQKLRERDADVNYTLKGIRRFR